MLSLRIQPISNPKNTAKYYFSKDNYYYTGELSTQWFGVSAEKLHLEGEVELNSLENVLGGMLPNGEIIGLKSISGEIKHRCGYDLTFSAPKSVSYMALVAGHKDFITLHQQAVQKVLGIIETHAAEARKSGKDGVEYEKTGNLCIATILHGTSREHDPHLHIHAQMMNLTERLDGQWRALASDISRNHGTMEWVMNNQIFLGLVYRSEIALGLKAMGLEIEHTGDPHGLFEIKHFDQPLMDRLSKRRLQIEDRVDEMHSSSLKAHDRATQDTRREKEAVDPETLRERWRTESLRLGIEPSTYFETLKHKTAEKPFSASVADKTYEQGGPVLDAIAHLSEKKLAFTYQDILQASLYFSLSEQGVDALMHQIDGEISGHRLIAIDDEDKRFTTHELIAKERLLIEKLAQFKPQKNAIPRDARRMHSLTENESIQQVVQDALANKSGIVRIQQQSATSREVLKTLIDYADDSKKIRVLSPTSMTANSINQERRATPQTLWQWVMAIGKHDIAETVVGFNHRHKHDHQLPFFKSRQGRELLIVDESQRLSPDDMNNLLAIAGQRAAKVIFLEKPDGLSGFKSDMPGLLDKAKIKTLRVDDKPKRTTEINLMEVREKDARILKTAEHYASLSEDTRKNTRVLTVSKLEAHETNAAIRVQLKALGAIEAEEKTINTLTRVSLTDTEKRLAKSYKPDWVIIHTTRAASRKLTIMTAHEKDNQLTVRDRDGVISHLSTKDIGHASQVYEQTPMLVGVGDQLVATGSLVSAGIKVGSHYDVAGFSRFGIKLKQGKKTIHLPLDPKTDLPLTHGYATTIYANDFKTVDNTILTLPAYALRKNTLALVSESTRETLVIMTDDVRKAQRYAEKVTTNPSAISLTLDTATTHYGLQTINDETTHDLLNTLDTAISMLTDEKPSISDSEKALKFAIAHLSEREAAFSSTELLEVAIQRAIGRVSIDSLYSTLTQLTDKGDLIAANQGFMTTKEALDFETSILAMVSAGLNTVKPFLSEADAKDKLEQARLTTGQKAACQLITTTSDQFIVVQGFAGTGKTTMTRTAIDAIEYAQSMTDGKIDLIAVAPTHQAVKEMKALGISAQTLKSFLIEQAFDTTLTSQSLVLLDESSMVSNRDCSILVQLVHGAGARCAFLGDISQHQSIESGKPSKLMMQDGQVRIAWMDDIVRQQVAGYKKAVETLVKGDTGSALSQFAALPLVSIERGSDHAHFNALKTSVIEVGADNTPIGMAVRDYLSRTPACRDNTVVIIHENKNREIANELIRESLMKETTLGDENKRFSRLLSTNYTTAELYYTQTYQDCLKQPEPHYLKKDNEYYRIVSVDTKSNVVTLKDTQGKSSIFLPEKESQDWTIELFKMFPGKVSVGEKIHFKKTDKSRGRFSNERVEVTSVSDDSFTVKDAQDNSHVLLKKDLFDCHWDYSYTATSYSIQGSSSQFVIGVADTGNKKTSHFRSFYIMVSRGALHAMVYTDNYDKLKNQIQVVPDKTSALEALDRISTDIKRRSNELPAVEVKNQPAIQSTPPTTTHATVAPSYDANVIVQHLNAQAEKVIKSLLGEPNASLSSKKEYRYGTKGSLSFCLDGEKRGTWYNFETMDKGNLLHLIQHELGLDFKSSLKYAVELTGNMISEHRFTVNKKPESNQKKTKPETSKTYDYALRLARESKPIAGTLAERYLNEVRGIQDTSGHDIRFHPGVYTSETETRKNRPSLISIARNADNKIACVEAIYLDDITAKKAVMGIKSKKSLGSKNGAGVILNHGDLKDSITYITEGVETGLSVRDAVKHERVITTMGKSSLPNIDMGLLTNKVVLCLDNDGKAIEKDKAILDVISKLQQHGKEVIIAMPFRQGDFNDVERTNGIHGVINTLNKAVSLDRMKGTDNENRMSHDQIKTCLEKISNQIQMNLPETKDKAIEKTKSLQRFEMEL